MKEFTGWEYLLIDAANQYGLDKLTFEERLQWATDNLDELEQRAAEKGYWKEQPLYCKAVLAIRRAQRGEPMGHMVGLDAVCSGLQIMSALSGCEAGARATGLVDPNHRADAYTECTDIMRKHIPTLPNTARQPIKDCVMQTLYGSQTIAKKTFGEGTEEERAFHLALQELSPGSVSLLGDLLGTWQPYAMSHDWVLPDNHHVHIKVMVDQEKRIEVDELDHATFTYRFKEHCGEKSGLSNAANVIHSIDAYIMRSLIRRCSYDPDRVEYALIWIVSELVGRGDGSRQQLKWNQDNHHPLATMMERYDATKMACTSIVPYLDEDTVGYLTTRHLQKLSEILNQMLDYPPFPIICVHDEFKCHPNHMNQLRKHYREILAEISESTIMSDVASQLFGTRVQYRKPGNPDSKLPEKIRASNYALC